MELAQEAGGTYGGMYVVWALFADLVSQEFRHNHIRSIEHLSDRSLLPGAFYFSQMDGIFMSDDLSEEGTLFTASYFEERYPDDYAGLFCTGMMTVYHVPDSWETFDKLRPVLDRRLAQWRAERC